jgi:hypothetical protein
LSCSQRSSRWRARRTNPLAPGRRASSLGLSIVAALVLAAVLSCQDDIKPPVDNTPPGVLQDLTATATGMTWVDLSWTSTGDDGMERDAESCELRMLPSRAIDSEESWSQATQVPGTMPDPGDPGTALNYHVAGLEPDSLYGFAVRMHDNDGNLSAMSNAMTVRMAPPPPPDAGALEVRLRSSSTEGFQGARILLGDSVLVASATDSVYTFSLPPGEHAVTLEKGCSEILPGTEQSVQIVTNETAQLVWQIRLIRPVEVVSSPPGGTILVDGTPTGQTTPAELDCLAPGTHEVKVRWYGEAGPDSVQSATVGEDPVHLEFRYPRGALLEVYTYARCTFCPLADSAAEALYGHADLVRNGYAGIQVHTAALGDPFGNPYPAGVLDRITMYNIGSNAPYAIFNGTDRIEGVAQPYQNPPALIALYRQHVLDAQAQGPARIALRWVDAAHDPGHSVTGRMRVVLLDTFEDPGAVQVWAMVYKDELSALGAHGPQIFYRVARGFEMLGTLADLQLSAAGDATEIDASFSLENDTQWPDDHVGVVAFVQQPGDRSVLQMSHRELP